MFKLAARLNRSIVHHAHSRPLGVVCLSWKRFSSMYCLDPVLSKDVLRALQLLRANMEKSNPQLVGLMEDKVEEKLKRINNSVVEHYEHYKEEGLEFPGKEGYQEWDAKYFETTYGFMAKQYVIHCNRAQDHGLQSIDEMVKEILKIFQAQHPCLTLNEDAIYPYFEAFWAMSHSICQPKEIRFEDRAVTRIWESWLYGCDMADCLASLNISPEAVQSWFKIFEILILIPKATSDHPMLCLLSPPEYLRYYTYEEEISEIQCEVEKLKFTSEDKDYRKLIFWLGVANRIDVNMKEFHDRYEFL